MSLLPAGIPFGISGTMSKKMFAQSQPAVKNYVNLDPANERVEYYRKKGIGSNIGIPGAVGLGSGISHMMYRVPKVNFNRGPTRNNVRKMKKNEYNAMMARQAEERARANATRKREMNANVAAIAYSNNSIPKLDIDLPINIQGLVTEATKLIKEQKKREMKGRAPVPEPTVDEVIEAIRKAFIETEKGKVYHSSHLKAESKAPRNSYGKIILEYRRRVPIERDRLVKEHIDSKMPKIEAVLAKVREGMILGFPAPAPKPANKEANLLRFPELSEINFSSSSSSSAPTYVDPFAGLNASPNTTYNDFVQAGIDIESETVDHLTQSQRKNLLSKLSSMNKSEHNSFIDEFIKEALRKGGKRKTRKAKKSKKSRKVRRT